MDTGHLTFCEDLLRPTRAFPWGFLDLVAEPIRQATTIDIGRPVGRPPCRSLRPEFSLERFFELSGGPPDQTRWIAHYWRLPQDAESYLAGALHPSTRMIGFEIPPWLQAVCAKAGVPWIDMRPSPIRFGRDLYVALRCSDETTQERVRAWRVPEAEVRLEAALLGASVRMHASRLEESGRFAFGIDESIVYIGQAPYDAAVIAPEGRPLSVDDYRAKLAELLVGRRVLYKPHPMADWHAASEIAQLSEITGARIATCHQNAYQILSGRKDVQLVGISSGLLQEAAYFDKCAHVLYRPITALESDPPRPGSGYVNVRWSDFMAPEFWHSVLAPAGTVPPVRRLPPVQPNHARELLDQWWDYSKCLTWERSLWIEGFTRSGGGLLRQRVDELEARLRKLEAP